MFKIPNLGISFSNGDEWEDFCHSCLKIKHQNDNYKTVDASSGGDSGIDGFTATGEVYQCYCPEKEYTDKELYEKQRDKITKDIQKLYDYQNSIRPLLNGVKIKTWHFTTPLYKEKSLILHCNDKENLVKGWDLDFIDTDFKIAITDIGHFRQVMIYVLPDIGKVAGSAIDFTVSTPDSSIIDEYKNNTGNNLLINNAIDKNTKLFPQNGVDYSKNILERTNITIEDYLIGENIKKLWSNEFDTQYEKFLRLISTMEREVKKQSTLPFDDNAKKMEEIRKMVKDKLDIEFPNFLSESNKEEIASAVIADWLMRCPLNFI
ncbi:hypothetical protein [Epilithonimonas sp.]|uniref:hypothetical protein n=1 Tax=Epilithonimonas sp. TaxID=2894511 RepID=UPI0035B2736F